MFRFSLKRRTKVRREKIREAKEGINMCLVIFSHGNYIAYITKGMLLLVYVISCDVSFSS